MFLKHNTSIELKQMRNRNPSMWRLITGHMGAFVDGGVHNNAIIPFKAFISMKFTS